MIQQKLDQAAVSLASLTGIMSGLQSFPFMPHQAANAISHTHTALEALLAAVQMLHSAADTTAVGN